MILDLGILHFQGLPSLLVCNFGALDSLCEQVAPVARKTFPLIYLVYQLHSFPSSEDPSHNLLCFGHLSLYSNSFNTVYMRLPLKTTQKPLLVQGAAVLVVINIRQHAHVTPLLHKLCWLDFTRCWWLSIKPFMA